MDKIAFYMSMMAKGGAERVISNLANAYCRQGIEVTLITDNPDKQDGYPLDERVKRVILPQLNSRNRIKNITGRITNLRKAIKDSGAGAVVAFMRKSNLRAIIATRFMKVRVIVSVRSDPKREYSSKASQLLAKILFRRADGIVFQTEDARAFFPKKVQRKSAILENSLAPEFLRERYEGKRNNEIVTVGRLIGVKNHGLLLEGFSRISKDYPELTLKFYGDGEKGESLKEKVKELGLSERVLFMGNVQKVADEIERSRIFVLTSDIEGMPNALLESMSLGLACISTDCPVGGPRSVIEDGVNGLLIPVGDADALEQALRRILSDASFEERLGQQARDIQKRLHPDLINAKWMEYIERGIKD